MLAALVSLYGWKPGITFPADPMASVSGRSDACRQAAMDVWLHGRRVFNLGNMLLVAAISVAACGAFPIGMGVASCGRVLSYSPSPPASRFLFGGCA